MARTPGRPALNNSMAGVVLQCLAVFLWLIPGLGLPLARMCPLEPRERMTVAWLGGAVMLYLLTTGLYLSAVPAPAWRWLGLAAIAAWLTSWREARSWWRDRPARRQLAHWLLVSAWVLTALACIRNYSGGDWIGDWAGHYQRAVYFLRQDPSVRWIFTLDPLTARAPLQNLVTAGLLAFSSAGFAHYQVFTALLGTLVVFPLGLIAATIGRRSEAGACLSLLLVLNPMFVENATYPWTKLGCAAFVVAGLAFFIRAMPGDDLSRWVIAVLAFGAGVLAHYSAVPYFLVFAAAYLGLHRRVWRTADFWARTGRLGVAAGLLLATWFGWAVARTGWSATVGTNTTAQYLRVMSAGQQLAAFGLNLTRTLFPPAVLAMDDGFLTHANTAATMRDYAFSLYQTSLPCMIGTGALAILIGWTAMRRAGGWKRVPLPAGSWIVVAAIVVLGVAVHTAPVRWGVGHICLQPLALAVVAGVAGLVSGSSAWVRRWLAIGLVLDGAAGVALQLWIEHLAVPISALALQDGALLRRIYGLSLANNAAEKVALQFVFLGDGAWAPRFLLAIFALLLMLAVRLAAENLKPAIDLSRANPPESPPT